MSKLYNHIIVQKLAHDIHFTHLFVVIKQQFTQELVRLEIVLTTTPDGIDTNNLDNLPSC